MAIDRATRIAQAATGLLGVVGGLLAAVAAFDGQVRAAVEVFVHLSVFELAIVGTILLCIGTALFVFSRGKASQILDPDALRLDPHRPEHLIGRTEDIRLLHEKCIARPLVFLVGDSGAGKSALVRAGLVPAIDAAGRLIAVYLDMANLDWDGDACDALADCFWRALPQVGRDAVDASRPPAVAELPRLLAASYPILGRTPLVILDQIDDYQLRHRERFLPASSKNWISSDELVKTSAFWGMLSSLIRSRHLHILIITRSDNADGLESLRLADNPIVVRLDPLPAGFSLRIIDQLVTQPPGAGAIIENPEAGWTRLRVRLAQDLERGGSVLPQQLKISLLGLGRLGRLSVPTFERSGGVPGLEARYIADSVVRAALRGGLEPAIVRRTLVRLAEPNGMRRTPPVLVSELASDLAERDGARLGAALEALADANILRRRQLGGIDAWQLDHDYLARGVLRIEADADRWRIKLAQRAAEFSDARGSLLSRWRALLSIREQITFVFARVRGRFRYGEYRWFAVLSLAPHATGLALAGLAMTIGYVAVGDSVAKSAWAAVLTDVGFQDSSDAALTKIAEWPSVVRWAFVRQIFEEPHRALHVAIRPQPFVRAIVGLDRERASQLGRRIVETTTHTRTDAAVDVAAATIPLLPPSAWDALPPALAKSLAEARSRGVPLDVTVVRALSVTPQVEEDATRALEPILHELIDSGTVQPSSPDESQRIDLAEHLAPIGRRLSDDALAKGADRLREAIIAGLDQHSSVAALAIGYAMLARRLPSAGRERAVDFLIDSIEVQNPGSIVLASPLARVLAALPDEATARTSGILLEKIRQVRGNYAFVWALAQAFDVGVPPSAEAERAAVADAVFEELKAYLAATTFAAEPMVVTLLADTHAALTLPAAAGIIKRTEVQGMILQTISKLPATRGPTGDVTAESPATRMQRFYVLCGSNTCARMFAAAVIDKSVGKSFNERAMLIMELLKLPALATFDSRLLMRLRQEDEATAAGVPDGALWSVVAWAEAHGLNTSRPLDTDKLLDRLSK